MTSAEITIFYNRHKQRLFNTAMRITGDTFEAQEAVQNTVLKFLRSQSLEHLTAEQVEAWLHRACTREAIDRLRARKALTRRMEEMAAQPQETMTDEHETGGWDNVLADRTREQVERIKAKVAELPDGYRVVLSLVLFEGFDYDECAQILGVAQSTVRSQYLRGKNKLLELIKS